VSIRVSHIKAMLYILIIWFI